MSKLETLWKANNGDFHHYLISVKHNYSRKFLKCHITRDWGFSKDETEKIVRIVDDLDAFEHEDWLTFDDDKFDEMICLELGGY